jgi:HPt (histidine-containing phosphotransfer) domain-containing protein
VANKTPIDFAHLSKYTLNDRALEAEILGLFVSQLPETLARLRAAKTLAEWRAAAHTLKGSARAVGAGSLAEAAAAAEAMPEAESGRHAVIRQVSHEVSRAITFVSQSGAERP